MNLMSRLFNGFVLFAALLLSTASLSADWLLDFFTPVDHFGNRLNLFELHRKGQQLTRELQTAWERVQTKSALAEQLQNGERSLFEAAAWFRLLHEDPRSWHDPRRPRPEYDEGERWCRVVIEYATDKVRFDQSDSRANALRQRLEAALQEQLDYHGEVKLPE